MPLLDLIYGYVSQMLHGANIYLQNWVISGVNVGKYSIHGASGYVIASLTLNWSGLGKPRGKTKHTLSFSANDM
jgi:hypothetical protein